MGKKRTENDENHSLNCCTCGIHHIKKNYYAFVVVVAFLNTSFNLCSLREIWVALPGYGTAATRAVLPIPVSMCSIFMSKQLYGCQCLGFLTCAQVLRHAIVHWGCTDTVRLREPGFSFGHYQLSYSHPIVSINLTYSQAH